MEDTAFTYTGASNFRLYNYVLNCSMPCLFMGNSCAGNRRISFIVISGTLRSLDQTPGWFRFHRQTESNRNGCLVPIGNKVDNATANTIFSVLHYLIYMVITRSFQTFSETESILSVCPVFRNNTNCPKIFLSAQLFAVTARLPGKI